MIALIAAALAGDCEVVPLEVVGSLPDDDANSVPLDARIVGILGDGNGEPEDWTLTLETPEGSVAGTTDSWCHVDGGPEEQRCWLTLTPDQALEPDTTYDIILRADESAGVRDDFVWHEITTGSGTAPAVTGQPRLDVLEANDIDTDCDWEGGRHWELTASPASSDQYGLSLLHIYSLEQDGTKVHAATRAVSPGGGLVSVEVSRDIDDPFSECFLAIQEDNFGNLSDSSELACYEPPPPEDEGPDGQLGAGGCGCTQGGGPTPLSLFWVGLATAFVAGRRRG